MAAARDEAMALMEELSAGGRGEAATAIFERWTEGNVPRWDSMLRELRALKTTDPAPTPASGEIVDFRKILPPDSPRKTASPHGLKTDFADAEHWDALARKYLSRYNLPNWDERATPYSLQLWIERMDLPKRAFLKTGAYKSLDEAIALNRRWPLRALIGLALEARQEADE